MPKIRIEDYADYDDFDDELSFEKFRNRGKKTKPSRSGGHESRISKQDEWDLVQQAFEEVPEIEIPDPVPTPAPVSVSKPKEQQPVRQPEYQQQPKKEYTPRPAPILSDTYTKEIRGFKIDFSRLANIEMVEQQFQGHDSFGIKFLFAGQKGFYHIVWYGRNNYGRDMEFKDHYKYWLEVKDKTS